MPTDSTVLQALVFDGKGGATPIAASGMAAELAGDKLTYAELWSQALRLRAQLRKAGLNKGDTVAIALPRSSGFVVGLVATWLNGSVALLLDTSMPEERLNHILSEAKPHIILGRDELPTPDKTAEDVPEIAPEDPAYLIYTSEDCAIQAIIF